jgi:4a-hydroxytetrahydrobiopterin dehydratase
MLSAMWEEKENALCKTFHFTDFMQAFGWMSRVAIHAEEANHHPEWTNIYNKVIVKLQTHDAGNIVTDKDLQLAQTMDALYLEYKK